MVVPKRKVFVGLLFLFFILSIAANVFLLTQEISSFSSSTSESSVGSYDIEKDKALLLAKRYYAFLQEGDYDGSMSLHHDRWFQTMNRTDTKTFLQNNDEKVGKILEYTLESWEVKKYEENDGGRSGMYAMFTFSTKREKFSATETVTFFRGVEEDEYKILRYHVDSEAFNK